MPRRGQEGEEHAAENGNALQALIFKTIADPHVGQVSYFRVFRGAFNANSHVYNSVQEQGERIGQLFYRARQGAYRDRHRRHRRHRRGRQTRTLAHERHARR